MTATTDFMNSLAKGIDTCLNGKDEGARRTGFALLVFPLDSALGGNVNYVSSAERTTMLVAMKEIIARLEGYAAPDGHA